jgi:hypothetical protein
MKKYKKIYEGKSQAIQILQKTFGEKSKDIVNQLEKLDPTSPKNKYVEVFAKIFLDSKLSIEKFIEKFNRENLKEKISTLEKKSQKIDLTKIKTFEDFKNEVEKLSSTITKSSAKHGISGLTLGKDYLKINVKDENCKAYIPLNHKASKIIASSYLGGCTGKWCTAQNDDTYWEKYIQDTKGILVYILNENLDENNKNRKQAIFFYPNKENIERFDINDSSISKVFSESEIKKFIFSNWEKIREKFPEQKNWIEKAIIINAQYQIEQNQSVTWKGGTWEDGFWEDGVWENGTWKGGFWEDGVWENGTWDLGIWEDGTWKGGTWKGGTWKGGTWEDGFWEDGVWENGTWKGGFIYDPEKIGNFEKNWKWKGIYVYSPISPKKYFAKKKENIKIGKYKKIYE